MHLDTVCTMVDVDKIVMYPNVADSLTAYAVTVGDRGEGAHELVLDVADAEPFLVAAAKAMEIDTLHQIDTGLDPVTAEREQWDDGNNTLAIAPRVAVAYERNDETNVAARGGRHRGGPDRRLGAGLRPRRPALHELPDRPRAARRGLSHRRAARVPVLWLYGADAVGKSTVAWEIYSTLADARRAGGVRRHRLPALLLDRRRTRTRRPWWRRTCGRCGRTSRPPAHVPRGLRRRW